MKAIFYPEAKERIGYLPSIPYILKEIYIDRWYDRHLMGRKDLVIFDVGAYVGITAEYFSPFAKVIHAVEPNNENYECLLETIKYNHLDNVKLYKAALVGKDRMVQLFYGGQNSAHNILGGQLGSQEVEGWSLDTLFEKTGETQVDLLKMDIEGAEFEVLCGESFRRQAGNIKMIMGEIHSWANQNPNQIFWALRDNGYEVEIPPNDAMIYVARRV